MIPHPIQVRFHRPWSVPFTCKPNQAHLRSFPSAPAFQRVIPYCAALMTYFGVLAVYVSERAAARDAGEEWFPEGVT